MARALIDVDTDRRQRAGGQRGDPTGAVVTAASVTVQQIAVALRYTSSADAPMLLTRVFDRAANFEDANRAVIGAAGVMVDAVGQADESVIAGALVRCRAAFTDDELIRGAASFIAAWSVEIAQLTGIDPLTAHHEVVARLAPSRVECRRDRVVGLPSNPICPTSAGRTGSRPAASDRDESAWDDEMMPAAAPHDWTSNTLAEATPTLETPRRSTRT